MSPPQPKSGKSPELRVGARCPACLIVYALHLAKVGQLSLGRGVASRQISTKISTWSGHPRFSSRTKPDTSLLSISMVLPGPMPFLSVSLTMTTATNVASPPHISFSAPTPSQIHRSLCRDVHIPTERSSVVLYSNEEQGLLSWTGMDWVLSMSPLTEANWHILQHLSWRRAWGLRPAFCLNTCCVVLITESAVT